MAKSSSKSLIFDIGEWQHFFDDVLPDWIVNRASYDGEIAYKTINQFLIEPLSNFIQKSHERVPNSILVEAGNELVRYLDMGLASKFRSNETVVLEQIVTLKNLVNNFLAIYGSGEFAKTSSIKSKIAKASRIKNTPTKSELCKYKNDWLYNKGYERGWIKAAIYEFDISRSKLQEIMKS